MPQCCKTPVTSTTMANMTWQMMLRMPRCCRPLVSSTTMADATWCDDHGAMRQPWTLQRWRARTRQTLLYRSWHWLPSPHLLIKSLLLLSLRNFNGLVGSQLQFIQLIKLQQSMALGFIQRKSHCCGRAQSHYFQFNGQKCLDHLGAL